MTLSMRMPIEKHLNKIMVPQPAEARYDLDLAALEPVSVTSTLVPCTAHTANHEIHRRPAPARSGTHEAARVGPVGLRSVSTLAKFNRNPNPYPATSKSATCATLLTLTCLGKARGRARE